MSCYIEYQQAVSLTAMFDSTEKTELWLHVAVEKFYSWIK